MNKFFLNLFVIIHVLSFYSFCHKLVCPHGLTLAIMLCNILLLVLLYFSIVNCISSHGSYQSSQGSYKSTHGSYQSTSGPYQSTSGPFKSTHSSFISNYGPFTSSSGGISQSTNDITPRTDGIKPRTDGLPPRTDGLPPRTDGLPPRTDGLKLNDNNPTILNQISNNNNTSTRKADAIQAKYSDDKPKPSRHLKTILFASSGLVIIAVIASIIASRKVEK